MVRQAWQGKDCKKMMDAFNAEETDSDVAPIFGSHSEDDRVIEECNSPRGLKKYWLFNAKSNFYVSLCMTNVELYFCIHLVSLGESGQPMSYQHKNGSGSVRQQQAVEQPHPAPGMLPRFGGLIK